MLTRYYFLLAVGASLTLAMPPKKDTNQPPAPMANPPDEVYQGTEVPMDALKDQGAILSNADRFGKKPNYKMEPHIDPDGEAGGDGKMKKNDPYIPTTTDHSVAEGYAKKAEEPTDGKVLTINSKEPPPSDWADVNKAKDHRGIKTFMDNEAEVVTQGPIPLDRVTKMEPVVETPGGTTKLGSPIPDPFNTGAAPPPPPTGGTPPPAPQQGSSTQAPPPPPPPKSDSSSSLSSAPSTDPEPPKKKKKTG
ncbi:hypothetical protein BDZ85DRAFT_254585 [Elsinoe ampelina]|uniref:Uncharacterized protein n=1 Tax=Elsinoe ampelina TaxID=302913 RepID=A0A6A6GPM0_9PEZI|nr:hypothetical protein BDZ85DRAFT_254585 [Elsinoe ampelina]